jgi:hypothetical protein
MSQLYEVSTRSMPNLDRAQGAESCAHSFAVNKVSCIPFAMHARWILAILLIAVLRQVEYWVNFLVVNKGFHSSVSRYMFAGYQRFFALQSISSECSNIYNVSSTFIHPRGSATVTLAVVLFLGFLDFFTPALDSRMAPILIVES